MRDAAMEIAERFAYKGVAANLITYLTGPLGQPMARAAASIDAWKGVSQMLPLPLACLADAWIGRYRAIILASLIFVVVSPSLLRLFEALESLCSLLAVLY